MEEEAEEHPALPALSAEEEAAVNAALGRGPLEEVLAKSDFTSASSLPSREESCVEGMMPNMV